MKALSAEPYHGERQMMGHETQGRIRELLRMRAQVTDLLQTIDKRLEDLGHEPLAHATRGYNPVVEANMKRSNTVTGKRFCYHGTLSGDLIVYPTDRDGVKRSGTKVLIPSREIDFIRAEIHNAGEIPMGACRDSPSPGSLGKKLRQRRKSPQFLSYVIPLLIEEGFCTCLKEGRGYVVRYIRP